MSSETGTKRSSSDGGDWGGNKKARGDTVTLRFLLQSKHAGGIIGKGGETIKRLRSQFSAHVTVPDTNTGERVLTIGAEKEQCIEVLKECLTLVHEPPYPVNTPGRGGPNPFEIDFLVHSSQVGGIIGKGGSRIKTIREQTNAKIKVYQDSLPDSSERVVAIGGEEDQVLGALNQMLDILEDEPVKGNVTLYDPSYEHPTGYDTYSGTFDNFSGPPGNGGGGGMGRMGGGGGSGRGRGGSRGRGGGGGNFGGGPPPQRGGGYGGYGGGDGGGMGQDFGFGQGGGGNSGGFGNNGGGGFGGSDNGGTFGGSGNFGGIGGGAGTPSTSQVTVPNDMAGSIIGRGGERIRGIRQKCGADIKFSESEEKSGERLITISGSQDQIQYAQYLMQQCVRENFHGN